MLLVDSSIEGSLYSFLIYEWTEFDECFKRFILGRLIWWNYLGYWPIICFFVLYPQMYVHCNKAFSLIKCFFLSFIDIFVSNALTYCSHLSYNLNNKKQDDKYPFLKISFDDFKKMFLLHITDTSTELYFLVLRVYWYLGNRTFTSLLTSFFSILLATHTPTHSPSSLCLTSPPLY